MSISIVVPMYNLERYITPLLDSLLGQSGTDFEVILVDDGSKDNTYKTAEAILARNPGLRSQLIRTDNSGVSAARNTGLAAAGGDYVLFLDGDDYAASGLVEHIELHTRSGAPDIICWGYSLVREDQSTIVSFTSAAGDTSGSEALKRVFVQRSLRIWTGSIAFRRSFLLEHGLRYTERCVNGEDQEFIYKALARAKRVVSRPEVLSFYVQRASSISGTYNVNKFDMVAAFKRTEAYFRAHPFEGTPEVSELLLGRELTENFFYNLKTCLNGTAGTHISRLLQDIEARYPGLLQELRPVMRGYQGGDRQLTLQIKAFLFSPSVYGFLIAVDRGYIQLKQKLRALLGRKEIKL
ncbi:glycosyltransferase family A protein [Paenibacillus sp. MMS20-IR301]|uniref:glycosyltransferase family 2 protein n=1 Tax=Paenibacillus sp. MMS20-IR301 TaxID=2895946 RepID=UPI0028E357A0|nr:glycosyltransferase family A protein [Paenibacillus sp. MMS20-IR301]WNS41980.1 glycosyltransferase family A protein [Paenibacillus sp. MMS20-IR301]